MSALLHGRRAGDPERSAAPGVPASACGLCATAAAQAQQARCPGRCCSCGRADGSPSSGVAAAAIAPAVPEHTEHMLEDYFEELPSRKWEACAEAFDDYCRDDPESGEIQR